MVPLFMWGRKSDAPDFAYPQQVIKNADAMLDKAIKDGDGRRVVTALIQAGLAQTAISPDSLPSVVRRIESVAAVEKDAVTRSLLELLTADIYGAYYQENSYDLDRRPPLADPGSDITLWSGKEFKDTITGLYKAALSRESALRGARLSDYESIIVGDKSTELFYPTLFDFASVRAVDGIAQLNNSTVRVLSPLFFTTINLSLPNVMSKPSQTAIRIADRWVEVNNGAPRVAAMLRRYDLLMPYVVSTDDDEEETASPLTQLYRDNRSNLYAVEFLLREDTFSMSQQQNAELYNALKEFETAHPDYYRINAVKNMLDRLSRSAIAVSSPSQVARGKEFTIKVTLTNLNSAELLVYRVSRNAFRINASSYRLRDCDKTPVARIPVSNKCIVPFTDASKVVCRLDDYGVYVIVSADAKRKDNDYYQAVTCSDIALTDVRAINAMNVFAVDGTTGAPLNGVDITTYEMRRDSLARLRSRVTDASGMVTINPGSIRQLYVQGTKGNDRYGASMSEYLSRYSSPSNMAMASIRTSLAIYHPGDSLDFVAVVYDVARNSHSLVRDRQVRMILRNANYQPVDTLDMTTDAFGRAAGCFKLPSGGLTGNFTLVLVDAGDKELHYGSAKVMVSDYKLPTYEVKVDTLTVDTADGSVTVIGNAMTYSGFPVQNAVVEATLEGLQCGWWRQDAVKYHTDTLTTDAEGNFRWVLSKNVLEETPFINGRYRAGFTVTSASGENRTCGKMFTLADEAYISMRNSWLSADKNTVVKVDVLDALGNPIDAALKFKFTDSEGREYAFDAPCRGNVARLDLSSLRSATYSLEVTAAGIKAESFETDIIVYNATDSACPVSTGLWTPSLSVNADAGSRKAELVFGVASATPNLLMTTSHGESLIDCHWVEARTGMNRLTVNVPDSIADMRVRLVSITDFRASELVFNVSVENPADKLNVKIEHMRDKLTPLAGETVTVKVTDGSGKGEAAAVILDMYSKALDNLAVQSWRFTPVTIYVPAVVYGNSLSGNAYYNFSNPFRSLPENSVLVPQFNLYDMSWTGSSYRIVSQLYGAASGVRIRGSRSNAPVMYKMQSMEDDYEEEALMESAVTADADNGFADEVAADTATPEQSAKEEYRPAEVPLAFFAPMLSTDAEGRMTYSFTVPNANTTWVLNALAYNDVLATALDVREVISSKPVMVEPNLPRFLRTGDVADIRVSVMNATDNAAAVTTLFEVTDPATGNVISSQTIDSDIEARNSATVRFRIDAPAVEGALIVTVKSSAGSYSDGVRTLLPILSSSQPVIDATTFYLAPDQKEFTQELPASASGSKVTISFCENPTWEVVSALPGLRSDDASTSIGASAQLFAAAVSRYVMSLNPAIEPALKEWLNAAGDEGTLLSMLNRNDDLKQLVLASTPWLQQAQSDEERIARLALLFDSKEIDGSIKAAVAKLEKLNRPGGGWSWTENYDEPSYWATMLILNNFAELRQLGCYPSQLDGMVKSALSYVDNNVAKDYARYPYADYSFYAYVRSLYLDFPMTTGARKAYDATVQRTLKDWKKAGTATKAADALLLYRSSYPAVARQILESLREYATSTPQSGMWWDSVDSSNGMSLTRVGQTAFILQAFNTVDPGCAEIDKIRQWLILNKIVQDWGTSVDAMACVTAILQCGSSWLNRPGDAVVTIDGHKVEADRFDSLTGQIVAAVPDAKGQLKIDRTADGPAWGAVVAQSTQVMRDVKAHHIPELSVSKELFVRTDAGWASADRFTVGQMVKVRLVIKAARDMDYVTLVDNRAATFEPVVQTPRPVYCDGIVFYLENRDAATNLFINRLPKGQYVIEYEMNVNNEGEYSSGIATIQSQYAPEMTAHSAGLGLTVND
ncbi:MAG: hypothetical protein K2L73_00440 [Muribaculaceae bacterium]|nr:hypothetical protein [Muribaculaceae bacterium]